MDAPESPTRPTVPFLARYLAQGTVLFAVVFAVDRFLFGSPLEEAIYLAGMAGLFIPLLSVGSRRRR